MCSSQASWVEDKDQFLGLLVKLFLMQPRMLLAFLSAKGSLLAHAHLVLHHDPQVIFCRAAFQTVNSWDPTAHFSRCLKPLWITHLTCQALLRVLDCLPSCWGSLSPVIQVVDGAVGPYLSLGCSSSDWPPAGLCVTHQSPLDLQFSQVSVHLTVHLSNLYFISFSEAFMSECFESLAGVKVNNICCSPCIQRAGYCIAQGCHWLNMISPF